VETEVDANGGINHDFNAYGYDSYGFEGLDFEAYLPTVRINFKTKSFDNETPIRTV